MILNRLEWDSHFLSKKVGVVEVNDGLFMHYRTMDEYNLLYVLSSKRLLFPETFTKNFSVQLVDEKLTFKKRVSQTQKLDHAVILLPLDHIPDEDFQELAIQSGIFSRFKVDQRFPDQKFRELYLIWLQRSVSHIFADEVLVYKFGDTIAGFITMKMNEHFAEIGLLAVGNRFRGQGIAGKLLAAVENTAVIKKPNCSEIRVVTQAANKPACSLYMKNGYQMLPSQFVYHCWEQF